MSIRLWELYWGLNRDFSDESIRDAASFSGLSSSEIDTLFSEKDSEKVKEELKNATANATESGAFGAPWFVVENGVDQQIETFFGSDRLEAIAFTLSLPYYGPNPTTKLSPKL